MTRGLLFSSLLLSGCVTAQTAPLIEPSTSISGTLSASDGCYWLTTPDGLTREIAAANGARILHGATGYRFVGTDNSIREFGVAGAFIAGESAEIGSCSSDNLTFLYRAI